MKLTLLLLNALSISAATATSFVLHEKRSGAAPMWKRSRRASPYSALPVRVGLVQPNLDQIHDLLMDVSDPESPNYGNHWTPKQVADFFKPTPETFDAVISWLEGSGYERHRINVVPGSHWVEVNSTIAEAEKLLNAEYHVFEHPSGKKHVACDSYSVPAHIKHHVDLITPTVHFDAQIGRVSPGEISKRAEPESKPIPGIGKQIGSLDPKVPVQNGPSLHPGGQGAGYKHGHPEGNLDICDQQITPACLRALYNINYGKLKSTKKNSYGIVEYTPQAYLAGDLDLFFGTYAKSLVGSRPVLKSIDGGQVQVTQQSFGANGESDLDLQYGMALVKPQKVKLYQVGDLVEGASFNNFLDALDADYCTADGGDDPVQDGHYPDTQPGGYMGAEDCGTYRPANVISTSYSYNEADLSPAYEWRQCNEYAKLGLMGTTFLYSSGDNGVAGNGGVCLHSDGTQDPSGTIFNPTFPGTCPYVTSVGATQINPGNTVHDPESACEQVIFSGGGFSNVFPIPKYQKNAVGSYFRNHLPPYGSDRYNNSQVTRGFPDISANGANYVVAVDGTFSLVYGTSASTPVVGAMLTLINDARLAKHKRPIGFINPALYSKKFHNAHAFHDITSGGNQGCGTPGFTAVSGWDPVTGLGTPNFPKLLKAFMSWG